ncbi:MAG: transglycosylase domain-containing protein [Myxococcota bacterium]
MRKLRRLLAWAAGVAIVAIVAAAVPATIVYRKWAAEGVALAEQHRTHAVAHPGWSFPARVVTEPTPLTAPVKRLVSEAKARGYVEDCKEPGPGEFCGKAGKEKVVPRVGDALEPVTLGWLIGPDGELREHLPLAEAPKHLVDAILASEDRDFREHGGVNFLAMIRAVWANAAEGSYAQGGSTLTMQVVRNLAQRREKTVLRKLREMALARGLDAHLGKDGVLQMYLDAPYLGQRGSLSVCGFRAAARHYFGKDAKDLTLAEAATLAAILPAPGKYAPDRFPDRAKERRDRVLDAMATVYGYDVAAAKAEPIATVPPEPLPERWPAYLSATRAWLEQNLSPEALYGAGLVVTVGLDVHAQEEAEKLFPAKMRYFETLIGKKRPGEPLQAAAVLLDTDTGLVRAVFGGTDVTATSFNRATQARRQPGSSFKPLVYALAFEQKNPDGTPKFDASHTEPNAPRVFKTAQGDWKPRNVGGEYSETVCLAQGLAWSQNIATAALLEEIGGPKPLVAFAQKLGFDTSKFPEEMGLALGQAEVTPLEMAQFTAIVANGGHKVVGSPVISAVDAAGKARVAAPAAGEPVMSPEAAALTRELMRLVIDVGTGGASRGAGGDAGYTGQAMGKTGTTDSEKDLWFVGATPRYAMAVWLGYDQPTPLGVAASDLAAPLWGWWMHRVTKFEDPHPEFPAEPKLAKRWVCTITGKIAGPTCKGINAPYVSGRAPKAGCPVEHPPPPPEEELGPDGLPKPKHESLWKKLAREATEKAAAGGGPPKAPGKP